MAFHSRPDLLAPAVSILKRSPRASRKDIFLSPQFGPLQNGPMILDSRGHLVWFQPAPPGELAADFRVQTYQGNPVLTWWQGYAGAGAGDGRDLIYSTSYQQLASINAGNGLSADMHEFLITPGGTALITAYFPVYWDTSSIRGPKKQVVFDSVVQEIDIPTGLVLYQWDSLDHVPLVDSYAHLPRRAGLPYDYFHVNSATLDVDGNLIISGRNVWAVYKVSDSSGAILWTLGGKASSFRVAAAAHFAFQHDVEVRAANDRYVTLFDNGAGPPRVQPQSRALKLKLDLERHTAKLVMADQHSPALSTNFEGNVQELAGGDDFVGWGQQPYFSEFDSRGRLLLDGRFVGETSSYRAYMSNWGGMPTGAPSIAAVRTGKTDTVFASWNGATQIARWRVLGGRSGNRLGPLKVVPKLGFETTIVVPAVRHVSVVALNSAGAVLGRSDIAHPH